MNLIISIVISVSVIAWPTSETCIHNGKPAANLVSNSQGLDKSFEMQKVEILPEKFIFKMSESNRKGGRHPLKFSTTLTYYNKTIPLRLSMNTVTTASNVTLISYTSNGTLIMQNDSTDCSYYQGIGATGTEITATISFCDAGLEGIVSTEGKRLMLQPSKAHLPVLTPGNEFILGPHLLTEMDATDVGNYTFDYHVEIPDNETGPVRSRRSNPSQLTDTKYVELYLVNDVSMYNWLGRNVQNNMKRMKQVANVMDSLYQPHNIRIVLRAVEVWNNTNLITIDPVIRTTLSHFMKFRGENIYPRFKHDCAQLITRTDFTGPAIGLAAINGMCHLTWSANVNQDTSNDFWVSAATLTHEMGHNLGMQHDQSQCRCTDRLRSCLMSPYAQNPISTTFSSCSVQYLVKYLRTNRAGCLMNVPKKGLFYEEKICGNNKLDTGEDCDCGYPNFCKNPCCNAATCKFTPGSQCYSGACCKKCTISRKGDVCRPSADGLCDLEETCDGVNSACPDNFFHMNGKDCYQHGHAGYCFQGSCRSRTWQCKKIWGPAVLTAHTECYKKYNRYGIKMGHCGKLPSGSYVRCASENTLCGLPYCVGMPRTAFPTVGHTPWRTILYVTTSGKRHECVIGGAGRNPGEREDPFQMMPGVKCGEGMACNNSKCIPVAQISSTNCSSSCYSRGATCTHKGTCVDLSRIKANEGNCADRSQKVFTIVITLTFLFIAKL